MVPQPGSRLASSLRAQAELPTDKGPNEVQLQLPRVGSAQKSCPPPGGCSSGYPRLPLSTTSHCNAHTSQPPTPVRRRRQPQRAGPRWSRGGTCSGGRHGVRTPLKSAPAWPRDGFGGGGGASALLTLQPRRCHRVSRAWAGQLLPEALRALPHSGGWGGGVGRQEQRTRGPLLTWKSCWLLPEAPGQQPRLTLPYPQPSAASPLDPQLLGGGSGHCPHHSGSKGHCSAVYPPQCPSHSLLRGPLCAQNQMHQSCPFGPCKLPSKAPKVSRPLLLTKPLASFPTSLPSLLLRPSLFPATGLQEAELAFAPQFPQLGNLSQNQSDLPPSHVSCLLPQEAPPQ